jgi:hypothetical protein
MQMSKTERELFKQAVIREYRLKNEKKPKPVSDFLHKLRKITPINIAAGIIAAALVVHLKGWEMLAYLFLSGIIWLTLISTIVSAFLTKK